MNNCNKSNEDTDRDNDFFESLHRKPGTLGDVFNEHHGAYEDTNQSLIYHQCRDDHSMHSIPLYRKSMDDDDNPQEYEVWQTLIAKVVTGYRENKAMGTLALALLKRNDNECKIIVYRSKSQILASVILDRVKYYLFKHNKYWQFQDENSMCWSLSFQNDRDERIFLEQLLAQGYQLGTKSNEAINGMFQPLNGNGVDNEDNESSSVMKPRECTKQHLMNRTTKMSKTLPTLQSSMRTNYDLKESCSNCEVINNIETFIEPSSSMTKKGNATSSNSINYNNSAHLDNSLESSLLHTLVSEQNVFKSEIRMSVSQVEQKVQMIMNILDDIVKENTTQKVRNEDTILELEERIVLLKKDNRKLKSALNGTNKNDEQFVKQILDDYESHFEYFKINTKDLDLKTIIGNLIQLLNNNKEDLEQTTKRLDDINIIYHRNIEELEVSQSTLHKVQNKIKMMQNREFEMEKRLEELENLNSILTSELQSAKSKIENRIEKQADKTAGSVKAIMNDVYLEIASKLQSNAMVDEDTIQQLLGIVGTTIRHQTIKNLDNANS